MKRQEIFEYWEAKGVPRWVVFTVSTLLAAVVVWLVYEFGVRALFRL
jgi:hypothetical protein